jgi:hypothetical protein
MSLQALSRQLASRGRDGDSMLVHMTPGEVQGLQSLALAHGGSLTINPDTGLPEAGFLKKILPAIAGAGLAYFGLPPHLAAGLVGGGTALATGSLEKGLMAGLGAYGGAGLTAGLSGLGAQQLAAQQAAQQAATFGAEAGIASYAPATVPTGMEALSQGAKYAMSKPGEAIGAMGGMGKVAMMGGAAAAPFLAPEQQVQTSTPMPPGMIRPMRYTSQGWVPEEAYEATPENIDERWAAGVPRLPQQGFAAGGMPGRSPFGGFGGRFQQSMGFGGRPPAGMMPQQAMSGGPFQQSMGFGGRPPAGMMPPQAQAQFQRPQMAGYGMSGSPAQATQSMQGELDRFMAQRAQAPAPGVMAPQAQADQRFQAMRAQQTAQGGLDQLRQQLGGTTGGAFTQGFAEGGQARMGNRFTGISRAPELARPSLAQARQQPRVPGMAGQSAQAYNYLMGLGPGPAQIRPTFAKIEEAPWLKKKREEEAAAAARAAAPGAAPAYDPFNLGAGAVYDPGNLSGGGGSYATGGIADLAQGGRYLRGPGDGTSDSIKASINGQQPARLADGEFVVDARTVSEIGNGSSEAGAKKLYAMMDRVHAARRGAQRGKPSGADKYLPA